MMGNAWEVRTNSLAMTTYGLVHMDTPVLADQQGLSCISTGGVAVVMAKMLDNNLEVSGQNTKRRISVALWLTS